MKLNKLKPLARFLALACLLVMGWGNAWGQGTTNYPYVFTYTAGGKTYYLGTDLSRPEAFNPSKCIWYASNTIGTTNRSISNGSQYMKGTTTDMGNLTVGTGTNNANFRSDGKLGFYSSRYYYVYYDNGWKCSRNNYTDATRVTPYAVDTDTHEAIQAGPTVTPPEGGNEFHALGSKTYTHTNATEEKGYTDYQIRISGTNTTHHYWYDGEDHNQAPEPIVATYTYRWVLSVNMNGYASVDQNGVVTYSTAVPEYSRIGSLSCEATNNETGVILPVKYYSITFYNPNYLVDPVINSEANDSGTLDVWFTYPGTAPSDLKFYYTTDGTQPTTGDNEIAAGVHFTVTDGTTVSVMATATGHHSSEVVSEMVHLNTGVLGNTVILHDHEDHRWTYYSGVAADVDGGNYNTSYRGKIYSPNPRNVTITYNANGGQVSMSESQNKFVYCKTLEESATPGEYKYQVISNPFSKRPAGKGFGGWKIISGGDKIQGHNNNDVLALDEEITFTNLTYTSVNCTSANLVLEATWVDATITYIETNPGSGSTNDYSFTGGTYETNFIVLKNVNYSRTMTISSPCTIMMVEPDGSADYRGSYTFSGNITPNNSGVTKIENAKWNPSGNIAAGGKSLWIGRGVTCVTNTERTVTLASGGTVDQVVKIESGTFSSLTHYSSAPSSLVKQHLILGCDYDRAKNDNSKLTFTSTFLANRIDGGSGFNQEAFRTYSKSGSFMTEVSISNAAQSNSYYLSRYTTTGPGRSRYFEIEGGEWYANISGGQDNDGSTPTDKFAFTFRMKGGKVRGSIYGAAQQTNCVGNRLMVITGGEIGGWVAGAANGIQSGSGYLYGTTYVYFGGNAEIATKYQERNNHATTSIQNSIGGYVFGSGCGYDDSSHAGEVTVSTNVVLADNASVEYGVYGGGAYGYSSGTANVYVTGGQVASTYDSKYSVFGGVYGGARQNDGGSVNIYMTGGLISGSTHDSQDGGGLYGGSNSSGILSGDVSIKVLGGTVGVASAPGPVCGGGFGAPTRVEGNVDITLGSATSAPLLFGSVYGGSAKGIVNTSTSNHTHITVNNATMAGYVYGGGMGDSDNAADVNGNVTIDFKGGLTRYVFGGNYVKGAPKGTITINMTGGTVYEMFGGGDQAAYVAPSDGYPQINISGGRISRYNYGGEDAGGNVFGGGNLADVTGSPVVNITGSATQIDWNVYGGGNNGSVLSQASLSGSATVHVTDATVGNSVFGAGLGSGTVVAGNTSVTVDGKANVAGNIYGGGEAGDVAGNTAVVVGDTGSSTTTVNDVFGAGKGSESDVAGEGGTNVTINKSASVKGSVYGGAEEGTVRGEVTESPAEYGHNVTHVTINNGRVRGNVYGGGKMGVVNGRTIVDMLAGTVEGNLFGGALGAQGSVFVRGLKTINMKDGLVVGNIYGGSQNADDANEYYKEELEENEAQPADNHNSIFVNISGGQVGANVYGGGFYGEISGSLTVNVGVDAINNGPDNAKNSNKLTLTDADKVMTKLEGSIYAGSDWGTVSESGQFGPNNITGYSNIYIDGGGYDMNAELQGNYMNISGSIYGSGTSSDAGSQGRRIFIRNYGLDHASEVEDAQNPGSMLWTYGTCSRKLFTIQRADSVFLENSHITFRGQGDMSAPSTTQHYSMYNIFRVLRLVNNSTVDCEYPVANLYSLNSMALLGEGKTIFNATIGNEDATTKTGDYTVVMYDRYEHSTDEQLYENPKFNYDITSQLADKVYLDDETAPAIDNKIRVDNGVYFAVRYPRAWNTGLTANQYQYGNENGAQTLYGELRGFFHIVYPQNCGFLYSRPRITTAEQPKDLIYNNNQDFTGYWQKENIYDGGTSSYRYARAFDPDGGNVTLTDHPHYNEQAYMLQGPYINHLPNTASGTATGPTPAGDVVCDRNYYRVWEIKGAGGDSQVEAVLVAKTDGTNTDKFMTTTTTIPLSPINRDGYVMIRHNGVTEPWGYWGDDVNMVNAGVISQGTSPDNYAYFVESPESHGWHGPVASDDPNVASELEQIRNLPNTTFGLSIMPMERLSVTQTRNGENWVETGDMLVSIGSVSDDNHLDNTRLYAGGDGATMLQLCLTYSNLLDRNTVLSPIIIFFDEYASDGTKLYTTEVHITITTQTTIDQNFDEPLYALEFGKGEVHDKFSVKATLPIFSLIPEQTESVLKVKSIGAPVFNPELTGGTPQLVSVSTFNGMAASEIEENVIAMKFGPSLTYDNTDGWLTGFSYDDPEASLVDITTLESASDYTLGTADGRKNIGMQFDLYYNGSVHFQGDNDVEICHFPLTLSVSNVAGSTGEADLEIMVHVYKRGKGTDWYIDGVKGRNSNTGHAPDHAKLTLNGVLADEYKPGDNIFIVNQVTINSANTTVWPDEKGGSVGVTLYRYPGGHTLKNPESDFQNGCYSGPLVVAKSDLQLYGIVLNGLDSICYNGKENYTINNVMYQKGENFDFTVNSPLVIVEDNGSVSMNRSEFIYNNNQSSTNLGGAVYVENGGTLNINGQSFITNNKTTTSEGAGVYVASGATVNVMDDVYVAGNTKGSVRSNVYLPAVASVINIDKENGLSLNSLIGVTKNAFPEEKNFTPIAFSPAQYMSEDAFNRGFFFDDQSIYAVYYDAYDPNLSENEIYFAKTWVTVVTSEPSGWTLNNIDSPEDLAWLISYVNGYNGSEPHPNAEATVTADLDMSSCIWVPIGDATNNFKGVFDGGGYDITGLRCSMTGISSQGLFGYVDKGTVKNTFVLDGTLTAKDRDRVYMGSIAGVVKNGGKVYASEGALNLNTIAESTIMGGLVGLLDESTLHSSISVANLRGYQMGGLVGETTEGSVLMNCYAFSMFNDAKVENESGVIIPNTHYVAGLVADNAIMIENCYVRRRKQNSVAGDSYAFDAHNKGAGQIKKCYTYEGDATAYTDVSVSPEIMGSAALYEDATHPYTYGENYNHTVRNAKRGLDMLKVLNFNVDSLCNVATYPGYDEAYQNEMVRWTRTTSDINSDFPVLKMPTGVAVSTNLTDSILYYHHTLNEALTRYSSSLSGYSGNAIVDAYANSETPVSVTQTENVKLYINEDVAVLQTVDLDAYVGITLDNSAGANGANPSTGGSDEVDWHMFSSSLQHAPLGLNYSDNDNHDWWIQSHAAYYSFYPDDDAKAGYFPGNTPTTDGKNNFDFYCFYEPEYHWINFKRNGNSHWHQDAGGGAHDWINYGYTGNDYTGSGTTGKYTFGKDGNNESEFIRGKGYLLAVEQETYLQAHGTLNNGPVTYYNVTNTTGSQIAGANLLGNPYQSYLDFKKFAEANAGEGKIWSAADKAFYVILDEERRGYVNYHYDASWNEYAANRYIHMHQGFFVATAQDSTTAVFTNDMRNAKGYNTTFRDDEQPRYPLVNLILEEGSGNMDYAVVELSRPKAGGAIKQKHLKSGKAQIYAHYNNEDYSIAFTEVGVASVPIRFMTDERNAFTLTWNTQNGDFSYLHLIDNLTGVDIDCLENDEYVFGADPTDFESRFKLVFQYTGVDENDFEVNGNFAFFNNDELIVNGEGQLECIDLQGRVLYVTDLYGPQSHVSLPEFSSGLYLLRFRNNKQVMVQKIIIK